MQLCDGLCHLKHVGEGRQWKVTFMQRLEALLVELCEYCGCGWVFPAGREANERSLQSERAWGFQRRGETNGAGSKRQQVLVRH